MLRLLGGVELVGGSSPGAVASSRQRSLVAALVLERGQVVSTDRLADRVWGENLPANPAASLQSHVSRLRRVLPDDVEITTVGAGYRLDAPDASIDVAVFERRFLDVCAAVPADRFPAVDQALAMWRGLPFGDLDVPEATAEAARLAEMYQSLVELRAEALIAGGRTHEAIAALDTLCQQHPLRERPVELLMRALVSTGRKTEALHAYHDLRTRLADELGLDPAPELRQLEASILREELVADSPALPLQPGPPEHRPSRAVGSPSSTVVLPSSSFIGRSREVEAVAGLLEEYRIVTLVGPGGVGKTRLATHVAAARIGTDGPVATFIELAPLRDPRQLADLLASSLGVLPQRGVETLDRIIETIGEQDLLLVIDNCEHVIDAAAGIVDRLSRGTPQLTVLATSREALNIDGECVRRVEPLAVNPPGADALGPAGRLFAERAAGSGHLLELDGSTRLKVDEICSQLDGLPLAIELAAARLATMSIDDIVEGLDERFEVFNRGRRTADQRHRSLWDVVDWSCRQMPADLHDLFARLSVFAGTFTVAAAAQVCQVGERAMADTIADLVDRSLLVEHHTQGETSRYGYLETIRAYAIEVLPESTLVETTRRHAAWVITMVEEMSRRLIGPDSGRAARRIAVELPQIRVAHRHLLSSDDAEGALRLSTALHHWALFGMHAEAFSWARTAAERFGDSGHPLLEPVCASASVGAWQIGDHELSRRFAEASMRAVVEDRPGAGTAAAEAMADVLSFQGEHAASLAMFRRAITLADEAGDLMRVTLNLADAAMIAGYLGDSGEASALCAEARRRLGPEGSSVVGAWIDYAEGEAIADARPDRALELLERSISAAESSSAPFIAGVAGVTRTTVRGRVGDDPDTVAAMIELVEHWHAAGAWTQQWITLRSVVEVLVRGGDLVGAATLLGAVLESDTTIEPTGPDAGRLGRARRAVYEARPDADTLVARGAAMTGDEAVDLALTALAGLPGVGGTPLASG